MALGMNFDEAREERSTRPNTFQIGGEVFTFHRGLRPETFTEYIAEYAEMALDIKGDEVIAIIDRTIMAFLDGDDADERWREVRSRDEDALTAGDMRKVLLWLIEEQTDRPTEAPSSSGNGRDTTGEKSTERSSSRRAASVVSEG